MHRIIAAVLLFATSGAAFATRVQQVPEPGVVELALLAGVVGYFVHKRRK